MPGMPRGLSSENRKSLYPENFVRKSKRRTSWASKEPHRKKQNYRRSVPCSFVFQTDSSPSSRGVQAGNADSAQRSQQHGGGLYISVTSQRPGGAIGQPRTVLQGIMGWQRGRFMQLVTPVSRFTQQRDRLRENLGIRHLNWSATYFYNWFKFKLFSWSTGSFLSQTSFWQRWNFKSFNLNIFSPQNSQNPKILRTFRSFALWFLGINRGCVFTRVHLLVVLSAGLYKDYCYYYWLNFWNVSKWASFSYQTQNSNLVEMFVFYRFQQWAEQNDLLIIKASHIWISEPRVIMTAGIRITDVHPTDDWLPPTSHWLTC